MTAKGYRPRDIRRLIESVEVSSLNNGTLLVVPKWKPPAGGLFTRTRIALWIGQTLNGKLRPAASASDAPPSRD
jgi:hypothetical protein